MTDIPFLQDLDPEDLNLVAPLFERYTAPAGTVIFEQGDQASYLYVIQHGTAAIRYKPYDGPQIVLTRLRAGDVFGWSSMGGSQVYTSGVISTTPIEALRIRGADLRRLCAEHPKTGYPLLERLAEAVSPRWKNAKYEIRNMFKTDSGDEQQ